MQNSMQIAGALIVLAAFILMQFNQVSPDAASYLIANAVGSALLAITAALGRQWGFLMLEGVWALVSLYGLVAHLRRPPATSRRLPGHGA